MEYFFQRTSDLIHEDETYNTVGIGLTASNPQYDLDVRDTVRTSNLITTGLIASSNILNTGAIETYEITSSNIEAQEALIPYVTASNVVASNLLATKFLEGLSINASSNLCWNGYSLHEPFPTDTTDWDDLIPFSGDTEGMIHSSWIYKPLSAKDIFEDFFNVAETVIDMAEFLKDMYDLYQLLKPDAEISDMFWDWDKIKNRPIASKGDNIGFNGHMYIGEDYQLKTCPSSKFTKGTISGITDFNFIQDNSPTDPTGDTILDFKKREITLCNVWLKEAYGTCNSSTRTTQITPTGIKTDLNQIYKIKDFIFSDTVISNSNSPISSIRFSESNNNISIAGAVQFDSNITVNDNTFCDKYMSKSNGGIQFSCNALKVEYQDNFTFNNSYLYMYNSALNFKTKAGDTPEVLQFSVDSNGTIYTRSNLLMPSTATIRSYMPESIDEPYREGVLNVSHNILRYVSRSNINGVNFDKIMWSVNSNGMAFGTRGAIFGKVETFETDPFLHTTFTNYPRLELGVENGLVYGYGVSNYALSGNYDVFKVGYKGQISTLNHSNYLMREIVNSNATLTAPLKIGACEIATDGTFTVGKLKIAPSGAVYMRFYAEHEMIISTIRQFSADTPNQPYQKSAFKF